MGHNHSHAKGERASGESKHNDNTWRYVVVICLTSSFFAVELVVGHITESLALVADSFHMLSDIVGLVVALFSHRISRLPASKRNTFGWQRAEVVGTAVNTVVLLTLAFTICIEAIQRFIKVECVRDPPLMFGVGMGGLVINVLALIILAGHGHSHADDHKQTKKPVTATEVPKDGQSVEGEKVRMLSNPPDCTVDMDGEAGTEDFEITLRSPNSLNEEGTDTDVNLAEARADKSVQIVLNPQRRIESGAMGMKAAFLHVLADALGSIVVIIVSVTLWITTGGSRKNTEEECEAKTPRALLYMDPGLSCILVVLIIITTSPLAYRSILVLLQSVPSSINIAELKTQLENLPGVLRVHDLHVWRLQGSAIIASVHVKFANVQDYLRLSKEMKRIFHEANIHCTTIQPEFHETSIGLTDDGCLLTCTSDLEGSDCVMQAVCCPVNKNGTPMKISPHLQSNTVKTRTPHEVNS